MTTIAHQALARAPSRASGRTPAPVIAGRVLSGLAILFLVMDAAGKLIAPQVMIAHSPPLGLPADPDFYRLLGAILGVCVGLYALPRTAFLGAVLLTGFLGGAVAMQLRVDMPLFSNVLFGVYLGALVWGGLVLRDPAIARAFGLRRATPERD